MFEGGQLVMIQDRSAFAPIIEFRTSIEWGAS